ncbi:MAG: recombinase family protein [Actinomycetota bacterium]|nr:recombinase family protein [Actinomycetota bacterium]
MRAAVYTRVSSDPKALGRSVAEQEAECLAVCERQAWRVVQVFCDNDKSASRYAKKQRPAYRQLREFVASGGCDVLITWECSRAQRDLQDYVSLRELCRGAGVLWSYSGRTYDLSRTDDRFTTGLDALLAERESDVTRDRILRTVRANAVNGRPHGKLPFGYVREYDPHTGALLRQVIQKEQAALVRATARRVLSGESCYSIAEDYNRRGVLPPRGGEWQSTQIKRLVTNPRYVSQRVHQGKVIGPADWPAILDESTFRQCLARLDDPSRKTTNEHAVKYLLSGIATCGVCGRIVKVQPQRGGYMAYMCKKFCVARKMEWVDDLIEALIIGRLSQPDALALFAAPNDNFGAVLDAIADKRARLEGFCDAAAKGEITPASLGRIEANLLTEIQVLESRIRRYDVPSVVYELANNSASRWTTLTLEQKREVIRCLMAIRLHRSTTLRGSRRFDPEAIEVRWTGSGVSGPTAQPIEAELRPNGV